MVDEAAFFVVVGVDEPADDYEINYENLMSACFSMDFNVPIGIILLL